MTGRNRSRRWLAIQGALLVVMGLALVWQSLHFSHQNRAQDRCQQQQFADLAKSSQARAKINGLDTASTVTVILTVADAKTAGDVRKALDEFRVAQEKIATARKDNPVPDFPTGSCK